MSEIPEYHFDLVKRVFEIEKQLNMASINSQPPHKRTQKPFVAPAKVESSNPSSQDHDAPLCADCGMMMTRTGACYSCNQCGAAGGCG